MLEQNLFQGILCSINPGHQWLSKKYTLRPTTMCGNTLHPSPQHQPFPLPCTLTQTTTPPPLSPFHQPTHPSFNWRVGRWMTVTGKAMCLDAQTFLLSQIMCKLCKKSFRWDYKPRYLSNPHVCKEIACIHMLKILWPISEFGVLWKH